MSKTKRVTRIESITAGEISTMRADIARRVDAAKAELADELEIDDLRKVAEAAARDFRRADEASEIARSERVHAEAVRDATRQNLESAVKIYEAEVARLEEAFAPPVVATLNTGAGRTRRKR